MNVFKFRLLLYSCHQIQDPGLGPWPLEFLRPDIWGLASSGHHQPQRCSVPAPRSGASLSHLQLHTHQVSPLCVSSQVLNHHCCPSAALIMYTFILCTLLYTAYSLAHLLQLFVSLMAWVDGLTTISANFFWCVFCALQDPGLFSSSSYISVCEFGWRGPGESSVCRGTTVCATLGPQSLLHWTAYHHSQSRGKWLLLSLRLCSFGVKYLIKGLFWSFCANLSLSCTVPKLSSSNLHKTWIVPFACSEWTVNKNSIKKNLKSNNVKLEGRLKRW